eukprot:3566085-Amphidinium_carterae.1
MLQGWRKYVPRALQYCSAALMSSLSRLVAVQVSLAFTFRSQHVEHHVVCNIGSGALAETRSASPG